jgi:AraC family transcriptional regulator of arabinose operon
MKAVEQRDRQRWHEAGLSYELMSTAMAPRIAEGFPGQRLLVLPPAVVRRAAALPVCRDLMVTHIGAYQTAPRHFVDRRKGTNEHVLIVCQGGQGVCSINNRQYPMTTGHAIVLPANVRHRYWADVSDPWKIFWVHFTGARSRDYMAMLALTPQKPVCWLHDLPGVVEAFEETYRHARGGFTDIDLFGLSTGFARLLGVCRLSQRALDVRRRFAEEQVLKTVHYMAANLHRPLTLAQLAAIASWSPTHYSMVFRRQLNLSPVEYLLRLKIQRACERLRTTDASIADVALDIGYDDPFYFSRLFRRRVGTSPRTYRRIYGGNFDDKHA